MTFYYDPTIDYHHRLPVSLGGLFPAYYLATQQPDDARALFDAALAQLGLADPSATVSLPGPRGTAMTMHLAREWGLHRLADALGDAADERFEPTWDHRQGEFTWGFGYGEDHPRGQHNAAMAAAEVMTEGAWWRLANTGPGDRFNQPTVAGIDFPDLAVTQAWWDAERGHLVLATESTSHAAYGRPTTFRIVTPDDPANWIVEDAAATAVSTRIIAGHLEVATTIGNHRFVARRRTS